MRWRRAWSVLSLDRSTSFFRELWLWIDAPPTFQASLRGMMAPWVLSADVFYDEAGDFEYALSVWFVKEFGPERYWHLSDWVQRIFVEGGADRATEFLWGMLLHEIGHMASADSTLSSGTHSAIVELCEAVKRSSRQLEERVTDAMERPLSRWDTDILRVESDGDIDTHTDDIANTIGLIMDYNLFLEVWDQYCAHLTSLELRHLYRVGVDIASRKGFGEEDHRNRIAFPGSWQLDARRFLRRFQDKEK